jgi:hypothetical protein
MRNVNTKKKEKREYRDMSKFYIKNMWWRAKKRAEKNGIEFDILKEDIIISQKCPVFGFDFVVGEGKGPSDKSPSLDRIDNTKGYTKSNIQVISFKANKMKNDCTLEDVEMLLFFMKNRR